MGTDEPHCKSEGRRSLGSGAVSGCSAKAEKEESEEMEKRSEENRTRIGGRVRSGSKKRE